MIVLSSIPSLIFDITFFLFKALYFCFVSFLVGLNKSCDFIYDFGWREFFSCDFPGQSTSERRPYFTNWKGQLAGHGQRTSCSCVATVRNTCASCCCTARWAHFPGLPGKTFIIWNVHSESCHAYFIQCHCNAKIPSALKCTLSYVLTSLMNRYGIAKTLQN